MRYDLVHASIPAMVRNQALVHTDCEALVDGEVRLTYAQLAEAMIDSARAAIAAGLQPGDRAAVWSPNSADWVVAALGVLAAGGVLVPLNTRFRGDEAAYVLRTSEASMVLTVGTFLGADYPTMLRDADPDLPALDRLVVLGTESWTAYLAAGAAVSRDDAIARIDAIIGDDLSDLMFTSGTTGAPKGVKLTHAQSIRAFGWMLDVFTFAPGDRYLVIPPFFHTFGYKAGWMGSLMHGVTVLPQRTFDAGSVLKKIADEKISVLLGPPTLFVDLMNHPDRHRYDLSSLRVTVPSAASVPVELVHRLREDLGFDVVLTAYGLTEATSCVSSSRVGDDPSDVANSVGVPALDIEVAIVDPGGRHLPPGETGEIWVRGYVVMQGYWNDPEATARVIDADGWLHTGDIGMLTERGFLRITDRLKDLFIVGGFNVAPAEVERVLLTHDDLAHAAVIGVADDRMGEVGMAFVVPKAGRSVTREQLREFAATKLANYKVPRYVRVVDDLPRNASMKVRKNELRALAADLLREE